MVLNSTTQAYIDGKSRDDEKETDRKRRAKDFRNARKRGEELKVERRKATDALTSKDEDFKKLLAAQAVEVKAVRRKLLQEEKDLLELRGLRVKDLSPLRSRLRIIDKEITSVQRRCADLKDSVEQVVRKTFSLYPDGLTSSLGRATNLTEVCKPERPIAVQGGLADGRGRTKRKLKRTGVKRRLI